MKKRLIYDISVPKIFFIYGNTCSGQSTIGMKMKSELGFHYISFGDLKRKEIMNKTEIGKMLQESIKKRKPIVPEIGARLIIKHIVNGYNVISGFPISKEELETFLKLREYKIEGIIILEITEEIASKRFFDRRVCPICHYPGGKGDKCKKHNIALTKRVDCNEKELSSRLELYRSRIKPFLESDELNKYPCIRLDVSMGSLESIFKYVRKFIENKDRKEDR
jgi:adenylate kinase family enzyme